MDKVRNTAVDILEKIEKGGAYSTILFSQVLKQQSLTALDRALLTELVYGTLQRKLTLDAIIQYFVDKPKKMSSWVKQLLRLAIYQMAYLDKIPDHAIIFETVEIAKKRGHVGISKFVNGVLRSIQRQGFPNFDLEDPIRRIHLLYSMPIWLVEKLVNEYGLDTTEKIAASVLTPAHMSARIQSLDKNRNELIEQLHEEGFEAVKSEMSNFGIRLKTGSVIHSTAFESGELTIQDESSMLVAPIGHIQKGERILDTCAAPGGKTTHMAAFIDETCGGEVCALDIHEHKIRLIEQNAKRLGVDKRIKTYQVDARHAAKLFEEESFDCIFVDAPCSGLGLMRRKPDIKYTKVEKDIHQLHKIQVEILNSIAKLVKKGGRLIYSTCTLVNEENNQTVQSFLNEHPEFSIDVIEDYPHLSKCVQSNGSLQILPHHFQTDGFYICRLVKNG